MCVYMYMCICTCVYVMYKYVYGCMYVCTFPLLIIKCNTIKFSNTLYMAMCLKLMFSLLPTFWVFIVIPLYFRLNTIITIQTKSSVLYGTVAFLSITGRWECKNVKSYLQHRKPVKHALIG